MDPKLQLKPIELLDIGIDKHTKIPLPILNNNMVSTYDMENGVPTDSFILTFDASYNAKEFSMTVTTNLGIQLSFDYGDGTVESWLISGSTSISHIYASTSTYTITASGWLDKVIGIISNTGGIKLAILSQIKRLSNLNFSNNYLISLDLSGMVYLNEILLDNNYLPNDVIDDLYIQTDTFLTFNGNMNTSGVNNGKPSIYSISDRNSLISKGWTLIYNT